MELEKNENQDIIDNDEISLEEENTCEEDCIKKDPESEEILLAHTRYRKKLWRKIIAVLVSVMLIVFTRAFPKYEDFDVVKQSQLLLAMFTITMAITILCFFYLLLTKKSSPGYKSNLLKKRLVEVLDLVSIVPIFIALIALSNAFILSPATVEGASMEPTYYNEEDVLIYHYNVEAKLFDVVILKVANGDYYIKRVIGTPGDLVEINNNQIFVNGTMIDQTFIEDEAGSMLSYTYCNSAHELVCQFEVPQHNYFVLGDNRENSTDSRVTSVGFIDEDQIYGKVIYKFNNMFKNFLK